MKTSETMKHTHKRSEFTPGPWTIEAYQYNSALYIQQPDDQTNGGWVVATVWGDDREANARLIAAAPDYHAWTNEVLEFCDEMGSPAWKDLMSRGRAIKSKAEGAQ